MKKFINSSERYMLSPVDLHLVSWNRPQMTKLVIETIHRNTNPSHFRLSVLDNGSDLKTTTMLKKLYDENKIDELNLFPINQGLEWARQQMLRTMTFDGYEYFICVDNDCLPPTKTEHGQDWIECLVELMQKYEDFAAISARTQVMIGTGNIFEEADQVGDDIVEFPHPGGSLRIMRTDVVKLVGGWDRGADGRGAEERYIGAKLAEAGFRTAFATKVRCLHLFGTRGDNPTDRWGYDVNLAPQDTGHSDISHPALTNGDDKEELDLYCGQKLTEEYLSGS